MAHDLSLRLATSADEPFLLAVYASTRAEELAQVPWTEEQRTEFVRMQFDAQARAYRETYQGARFLVVEDGGEPVGRLYVWRNDPARDIRIVDIALLPAHRGGGIGSALLADVLDEADQAGFTVSLHVEEWNPAVALYERLGFTRVGRTGVYDRMERSPHAAVS